jgi:hypothetical protein
VGEEQLDRESSEGKVQLEHGNHLKREVRGASPPRGGVVVVVVGRVTCWTPEYGLQFNIMLLLLLLSGVEPSSLHQCGQDSPPVLEAGAPLPHRRQVGFNDKTHHVFRVCHMTWLPRVGSLWSELNGPPCNRPD